MKTIIAIDNLAEYEKNLIGKRIALITNPTGVSAKLKSTIDIINEKFNLVCMLSPEHGIRGNLQAGDKVNSYIDEKTNLPVHSLYGESPHLSQQILDSFDILLFDIQDVGARFYTFLYTLSYAMEDCAKANKQVFVIDRPNPILPKGVMGSVLDMKFSSFVGKFPLATAYGLTIGEYAKMINATQKINCDLTVMPMQNYSREQYYTDTELAWISPSPNLPTLESCLCYIGTCLFEGTNISEGRGTTKPFEIIGAPFIVAKKVIEQVKVDGAILREIYFTPTFSKFSGELCCGVQIHITDKKVFTPFELGIKLICCLRKNFKEFEFLPPPQNTNGRQFVTLLLGSDEILQDDFSVDDFLQKQAKLREIYETQIKEYWIYK